MPPQHAIRVSQVCSAWRRAVAGPQAMYWTDMARHASLPELLRPAVWLTAASPTKSGGPWLGRALGQTPPSEPFPPRTCQHSASTPHSAVHPCVLHSLASLPDAGSTSAVPPASIQYGQPYWAPAAMTEALQGPRALFDSALALASALEVQSDAELELSGTRRRQARLKTQEAGLLQAAIESSLGDVAVAQASGDIARASSSKWPGRSRFDSSATSDTAASAQADVEEGSASAPAAPDGTHGAAESTEPSGSSSGRRSLWARLSMRRRKHSDGTSPAGSAGSDSAAAASEPSPLVDVTAQTRSANGLPERTPRGRKASRAAAPSGSRGPRLSTEEAAGLRGNVGISSDDIAVTSSRSASPASEAFCGAEETGGTAGAEHTCVSVAAAATTPSAFSTASATAFSQLTPSPQRPHETPASTAEAVPSEARPSPPRATPSETQEETQQPPMPPMSALQVPLASGMPARPGQVIAGYHGLTAEQQQEWHDITQALEELQPTIDQQVHACDVASASVQRAAVVMYTAAAAVCSEPSQAGHTCVAGPWNTLVPASPFLHECTKVHAATAAAAAQEDSPPIPALQWQWESTHAQIDADVGRTFGEIVLAHATKRGAAMDDSDDEQDFQPNDGSPLPAVCAHALPEARCVPALRASLRRVLLAFAVLDPHVGYCQGMNFMAALLLRVFNGHEVTALYMLMLLVRRYGMSRMFSSGLSGADVAFKQMDASLAHCIPMLSRHLASQEISCAMYAAGWYMTVFSSQSTLPCRTVARVWDGFLLEGWQAVHRTSVALLGLCAGRLLAHDFMVNVQFLLTSLPLALKDAVSAHHAAAATAQHAAMEAQAEEGQEYSASAEQLSVMSPAPAAAVSRAAMVHCEDHAFGQAAGQLLLRKAEGYDIQNADLNRIADMVVAAGEGKVYTTATAARAFGGVAADVVVDGSLRAAMSSKQLTA